MPRGRSTAHSSAFGERWARHWLDLVRYAETRGHEFDPSIPNAYSIRDYLVRAFNGDVPWSFRPRAGRRRPARSPNQPSRGFDESILGTGGLVPGAGKSTRPWTSARTGPTGSTTAWTIFGKAFLGLTIACARCHDHKFDAISQRDYYGLSGFLIGSGYRQARFESNDAERKVAGEVDALRDEARTRLLPRMARAQAAAAGPRGRDPDGLPRPAASRGPARPTSNGPLVAESARRRRRALLDRWLPEVVAARDDPRHPLHAFAKDRRRARRARPATRLGRATSGDDCCKRSKLGSDRPRRPRPLGLCRLESRTFLAERRTGRYVPAVSAVSSSAMDNRIKVSIERPPTADPSGTGTRTPRQPARSRPAGRVGPAPGGSCTPEFTLGRAGSGTSSGARPGPTRRSTRT
ncbi:MAG: DUF1549 domain-containing protein [Isosphaeraceae bacterium]